MLLFVPIVLVFLVALAGPFLAGDFRLTRKQQREWEASWASLTPEEHERLAKLYHSI